MVYSCDICKSVINTEICTDPYNIILVNNNQRTSTRYHLCDGCYDRIVNDITFERIKHDNYNRLRDRREGIF